METERQDIIDSVVINAINSAYIYPYIISACALLARKKTVKKYDEKKAARAFLFPIELSMREMSETWAELKGNKWYEILTTRERIIAAFDILEFNRDIIEEIVNDGFRQINKYIYFIKNKKLTIEECRNMYFLPGGKETTEEKYNEYVKSKEEK